MSYGSTELLLSRAAEDEEAEEEELSVLMALLYN